MGTLRLKGVPYPIATQTAMPDSVNPSYLRDILNKKLNRNLRFVGIARSSASNA
jgi:hypothetical protein